MYAMDAVKTVCKRVGISARQVGRDMDMGDNYVSRIANRGSEPRCDTLAKMLGVCGYALCAVPENEIPENALRITAREETE